MNPTIAKNLLENKTCENCGHIRWCEYSDTNRPPEANTCSYWKPNDFPNLLNIFGNKYPSLAAQDIIKVEPMKHSSDQIYYLKPIYSNPIKRLFRHIFKRRIVRRMK
jgi:hypothetical protein